MANFFDQFDATASPTANFFDQFDEPKPASFAERFTGEELRGRPYVPYTKYPPGLPTAFTDVPKEIGAAAREGASTLYENTVGQIGRPDGQMPSFLAPAKAIGGALSVAASPITGAARSLIGHPYSEVTGIPYEKSKEAVDLGMAAMAPARGSLPAKVPTIGELKKAAGNLYQSPEVTSVVIQPKALTDTVETLLQKNLAGINPHTTPTTYGILQDARTAPAGSTVTAENLLTLRQSLGNVYRPPSPLNNAAQENRAASLAIRAIDDMLEGLQPQSVIAGDAQAASAALKEANANYNSAMQAEKIDKKQVKAEIRAAVANSGQNVANTMRARMADVVLNPAETRGMSPEALQQAESIARGTVTQNALRGAGNLMGGGGGLGMLASGAVGVAAGGPPGAILPALGFALKKIGNVLTMRQVEKLSETIRANSPLGQAMEATASDWQTKYGRLASEPTSKNFAAFTLASRNLANNLSTAGIRLSPSQLIQSIESRAKDDQNEQGPLP